jgi:hypothetical protein
LQLADVLKSERNKFGLFKAGRDVYMYVGHLYLCLMRLTSHQTERVSLVGMISTFIELVDGAAWVLVRRESYQTMVDDPEIEFYGGTPEAIETMFKCGFLEVSN